MVDTPLGRAVEKGGRRVQKDGSSARDRNQHKHILAQWTRDSPLDKSLVTLLRILLRSVTEVTGSDGAANSVVVLAARENVVLVPVHDAEELLADVLSPPHRATLNKVFRAPGVAAKERQRPGKTSTHHSHERT